MNRDLSVLFLVFLNSIGAFTDIVLVLHAGSSGEEKKTLYA